MKKQMTAVQDGHVLATACSGARGVAP